MELCTHAIGTADDIVQQRIERHRNVGIFRSDRRSCIQDVPHVQEHLDLAPVGWDLCADLTIQVYHCRHMLEIDDCGAARLVLGAGAHIADLQEGARMAPVVIDLTQTPPMRVRVYARLAGPVDGEAAR